jgi:hypothetical protein
MMQTEDQPQRARPANYTAEVAEAIIERLMYGEAPKIREVSGDSGGAGQEHARRWQEKRCRARIFDPADCNVSRAVVSTEIVEIM